MYKYIIKLKRTEKLIEFIARSKYHETSVIDTHDSSKSTTSLVFKLNNGEDIFYPKETTTIIDEQWMEK